MAEIMSQGTGKKQQKVPSSPPCWSQRIYLELDKRDIAYFRFLLESQDNLAYMSVVDRYTPVLKLTFSPGQAQEMQQFLEEIQSEIQIKLLPKLALPGEETQKEHCRPCSK
jgi:hypothetical protein